MGAKPRNPASVEHGVTFASDILEHFGVKGQKWGVRRSRSQLAPGSEDHQSVVGIKSQAKTQGTHTLTNAELKKAIERMNLEQQYSRLTVTAKQHGKKMASDILQEIGKNTVKDILSGVVRRKIGLAK